MTLLVQVSWHVLVLPGWTFFGVRSYCSVIMRTKLKRNVTVLSVLVTNVFFFSFGLSVTI